MNLTLCLQVFQTSLESHLHSQALRCFLADAGLEASWLRRLQSAGFVNPYVVANGVDSGDELAAKLGVPASPSLRALWTACDRYAELNAATTSRVSTKLCTPTTGACHAPAAAPHPVLSASKKRRAVVNPSKGWNPADRTRAREKAIPRQQFLWDAFRKLGPEGKLWNEYVSLKGSLKTEFEKLTKERLQTYSASCLPTAVSTYRRFGLSHQARNFRERPSPLHVALWPRERRAAGPTAASNALASVRWL